MRAACWRVPARDVSTGLEKYVPRNPNGYCPDHGTGVACPIGLGVGASDAESEAPIRFV
jgi:hypothetical protein